jgi:hypothetical protein
MKDEAQRWRLRFGAEAGKLRFRFGPFLVTFQKSGKLFIAGKRLPNRRHLEAFAHAFSFRISDT